MNELKKLTVFQALFIFGVATLYFFLLLITLYPFLKLQFSFNPALYWFITGYFLFIPLFSYALVAARYEGNPQVKQILQALSIRSLTGNDWRYVITGTFSVFILTGLIFGISMVSHQHFGTRLLNTTPWFMEMKPFQKTEQLLLLVWLPMFFFNIVGEEILWRGYVQTRLDGKYAWLLCSLLWLIFHIPFGIDLLIMLLPCLLIIPYTFYKTRNTVVGILIHGIYNGPMFVLVALGIIK